MISCRRLCSAFLLIAVSAAALSAQRLDEAALGQLAWRAIGPAVMGGRIDDVAVEDHEQRHDLDADLRSPRRGLDRRHRPDALAARSGLGRHRRAQQSPELELRRRHLQVTRRRTHVDPYGAPRDAAHRPRHHRPRRSRHRLRGRDGAVVGTQRRARRVQDGRWRPDLDERESHRPGHRLRRHGHGSREPAGALRGRLSTAPGTLGLQRRGPWQRALQDRGWGPHLDQAEPGTSGWNGRTHRPRHLAPGSAGALRHRRAPDRGRHLPVGRWRRDLAEDEQRQSAADVLQQDPHRPHQRPSPTRSPDEPARTTP
jgi:hypothetical protein